MTLEELAHQTGWSLADWTAAKNILGPESFPRLWRPIADIAGHTGATPAEIAAALVGDGTKPGIVNVDYLGGPRGRGGRS